MRNLLKCLWLLLVVLLLTQAAVAQIDEEQSSSHWWQDGPAVAPAPMPFHFSPPAGYMYLSSYFPYLLWSNGCISTTTAMFAGYLANNGFPNLSKKKVNGVWTVWPFPTSWTFNANESFLLPTDDPQMYPSECSLAATRAGYFGRDPSDRGHVDDYVGTGTGSFDPFHDSSPPWTEHVEDCLADFEGVSINNYRLNQNGQATFYFDRTGAPCHKLLPHFDTATNRYKNVQYLDMGNWCQIDFMAGFSQYCAAFAGYFARQEEATLDHVLYNSVADYWERYVKNLRINTTWNPAATQGITQAEARAVLDSGYPVILHLRCVTDASAGIHGMIAFGYNKAELDQNPNAQLVFMAYPCWNEWELGYQQQPYCLIPFPTEAEAYDPLSHSYNRASSGNQWWKLYGISTLRINNNPRCPGVEPTEAPEIHEQPGTVSILRLARGYSEYENYHVHYDLNKEPTPLSPTLTVIPGGYAYLPGITEDCAVYFKTYMDDAAAPADACLASAPTCRIYGVYGNDKNPKRKQDGETVRTVDGEVTHVYDADHFYLGDRGKNLCGIRVMSPSHGLLDGDQIQIAVGTIQTDFPGSDSTEIETRDNSERYIVASSFIKRTELVSPCKPLGMTEKYLGGSDYSPIGSLGGQVGVTNGIGLNNVGLLVRIVGKVTHIDTDCFTLDDGSGVIDKDSNPGVRVYAPSMVPTNMTVGQTILAINGVVSMDVDSSSNLLPLVLLRQKFTPPSTRVPDVTVVVP